MHLNNMIYNIYLSCCIITFCQSSNFMEFDFTLSEPMYFHAAGIHDNTLTVINGIGNGNVRSGSNSISLTSSSNGWTEHTFSLPSGTGRINTLINSVQVNNLLYIIDPCTDACSPPITNQKMFVYDLSLHQYTKTSTSLAILQVPCSVHNNNMIYVIGGFGGSNNPVVFTSTQRYDITNDMWTQVGTINVGRYWAGCAMHAADIYLFGGTTSTSSQSWTGIKSIEKYSVANDEWIELYTTLSQTRFRHHCMLLPSNNMIYCMGGMGSNDLFLSSVEVFNPADPTMTSVTSYSIRRPRRDFQLNLWNDCMVISGGQLSGAVPTDSIEYFCPGDTTTTTPVTSKATVASDSKSAICFSSDSWVLTHPDFERKQIGQLEIYDKILTYDEADDKFFWDSLLVKLHFDEGEFLNDVLVPMREFILNNGETLTMTDNHLLYIGHAGLHRADEVKLGDKLKFYDGSYADVIGIKEVMKYPRNMVTYNGNLVINGIAISTFTDTIWGENEKWGKYLRIMMSYGYSYNIWRFPAYFAAYLWNDYVSVEFKDSMLKFYMNEKVGNNEDDETSWFDGFWSYS